MKGYEKKSLGNSYDSYPELTKSLEDPLYEQYIDGQGPLTIDEIPAVIRSSADFKQIVHEFGWPSLLEDSAIAPPQQFDNSTEFIQAFTSISPTRRLNNFPLWISAKPRRTIEASQPMSDIYGLYPALHRAYTIAPDLMSSLNDAYHDIKMKSKANDNPLYIELSESENRSFVAGAHMAYVLLGRLMKADDPTRIAELTNISMLKDRVITDAAEELYT